MALTLKGPLGSVSSSDMHRADGVRDLSQEPVPHVTSDRLAVMLLARHAASRPAAATARRVLSRDPLERLHADGALPSASLRAGQEVAAVWHFRTAGLMPRVARFGERLDRGAGGDEVSPRMIAACARFNVWAEWAHRQPVNPRITLVDITLDVAVDGLGMQQLADRRGCDRIRGKRLLCLALWKYAELAGWLEEAESEKVA